MTKTNNEVCQRGVDGSLGCGHDVGTSADICAMQGCSHRCDFSVRIPEKDFGRMAQATAQSLGVRVPDERHKFERTYGRPDSRNICWKCNQPRDAACHAVELPRSSCCDAPLNPSPTDTQLSAQSCSQCGKMAISSTQPGAAKCVEGEPMMHCSRPYRWCATHDDLMMRCEMRKALAQCEKYRGRISPSFCVQIPKEDYEILRDKINEK